MNDRTREAVEHLEWMARRHDGLTNAEKGDIQIVLSALEKVQQEIQDLMADLKLL
jgi:hypothetical protein